jgi:hypothetical protein
VPEIVRGHRILDFRNQPCERLTLELCDEIGSCERRPEFSFQHRAVAGRASFRVNCLTALGLPTRVHAVGQRAWLLSVHAEQQRPAERARETQNSSTDEVKEAP